MSRDCFYPNLLTRENAGVAELKAVFKWVKVTGQCCLHRRSGWVISLSQQPTPPWSMRCSLANGELSKRNPGISKLTGDTVGCLLAGAGSSPFGFPLSFCCQRVPVRSNKLREAGSEPAVCQLVWEVQLGKVQQQVLCSAGAESCFRGWICSLVVWTLPTVRCIYLVSVPLPGDLACVTVPQSWEKLAVGLLEQKGPFWSLCVKVWENQNRWDWPSSMFSCCGSPQLSVPDLAE